MHISCVSAVFLLSTNGVQGSARASRDIYEMLKLFDCKCTSNYFTVWSDFIAVHKLLASVCSAVC